MFIQIDETHPSPKDPPDLIVRNSLKSSNVLKEPSQAPDGQ
jgi:hypothetical protein